MEGHPPQTSVEDEIQPNDSASNVTGATNTSTMWVKAAQERAAAEANVDYIRRTMNLEETLAEIADEETDAKLREAEMKMIHAREQQEQALHRARREEEYALEEARKKAEREKRRRRAEMSMREIRALQDAETARRKEELARSNASSVVSKSTARRRSVTSGIYHDASEVFTRNIDETSVKQRVTEDNKTVCEEQESSVLTPVTSKNVIMTTTKNSPVESDCSSNVSVRRPVMTNVQNTKRVLTSTQAASTGQSRMPPASMDMSSVKKVNQYLARENFASRSVQIDETPLSSTLRQDAATFIPRRNEQLQRPPTSMPAATTTARSAQMQVPRQDGDRTVGFREPISNIANVSPLSYASMDPTAQLANAIDKLAITTETSQLPKSEIISFSGSAKDYKRFITNFEVNIGTMYLTEKRKLSYLIQYCTGEARALIEDCVMMDPDEGFTEAKRLLQKEYGKPYEIARSFIDSLTRGPTIANTDYDGIIGLAREMKKCQTTLSQIQYESDLNSTPTMYAIMHRLPDFMQQKWMEKALKFDKEGREPTFYDFFEFIQDRAAILKTSIGKEVLRKKLEKKSTAKVSDEKKKADKPKAARTLATSSEPESRAISTTSQPTVSKPADASTSKSATPKTCKHCSKDHYLNQCDSFKALDIEKRWDFVKENKLCFNCLNGGHRIDDCKYRKRCTECNRKHNVMLHKDKPPADGDKKTDKENIATTAVCTRNSKAIAFPVVAVTVRGHDHDVTTFAVLDQCSDTTLVTNALLDSLHIQGKNVPFSVDTVNGRSTDEKSRMIDLKLTSVDSGETFEIKKARSVQQIPVKISSVASAGDLKYYAHLSDLHLHSASNQEINLLIGSDAPNCFVIHSTRIGRSDEPYAQKTPFGWTVVGPLRCKQESNSPSNVNLLQSVSNDELSAQMSRFWKHDFPDAIHSSKEEYSIEDKIAERIVRPTVKKVDGRYLCKMPFRTRPQDIPNNRTLAETRMKYLCRKLQKDDTVKAAYVKCMEGYIRDGYARKVADAELKSEGQYGVSYVPHHAVTNPKKSGKVRVVFDCAAKFAGKSLNDHLYTGPDIVNSLLGVLFRFRQEQVAIVGDVEMMYLRIKVYPEDEKFLRILWWTGGDLEKKPETYSMTSQIFGAASSGFNATLGLRACADDGIGIFDADVIRSVHRNFYVDDYLMSVSDVPTAKSYIDQLQRLLAAGGFRLHKWMSSERDVLEAIEQSERAGTVKEITDDTTLPCERALGVTWNVERDGFVIDVDLKSKAADLPVTKRTILSVAAKLFDPLGFVAPVTLVPKLLMQDLCRQHLDWDDEAPENIQELWRNWLDDLPALKNVFVPRCVKPEEVRDELKTELHHFCDASEKGYGAVSYLKMSGKDDHFRISFLIGKSRLAPLKPMTIPRLELCGAVLDARLHEVFMRETDLKINEVFFWCDSMTVLGYIRNTTSRYKLFVANRLAVIHDLTEVHQWHHIDGTLNPADLASRGIAASDEDKLQFWLEGPAFLCDKIYPEAKVKFAPNVDRNEEEEGNVLASSAPEDHFVDRLIHRCSTWSKIRGVMKCMLRFISLLKGSKTTVTDDAIQDFDSIMIKHVQEEAFPEDYKYLQRNKGVRKGSTLAQLNPFIDAAGLIRVRGRLENSDLPEDMKTPILLPQRHRLTRLIIEDVHRKAAHSGVKQVISKLRENFWIIKCLAAVKSTIGECIVCKRIHKPQMTQIMAPLPTDRLTPDEPPFTRTGIDYFGPMYVRVARSTPKRWGVIFTCLACRAVHFEIAHSLDTDSFLGAFSRFTARRGVPKHIFSDNGTNFVAGERELNEMLEDMNEEKIRHAHADIRWNFLPPHASHMAGV